MKSFGIGEVARKGKLQPSAIRYYESMGLLPTPRRENGRRLYDASIFQHLSIIRIAQAAGFTISEIHTLLMAFPENTPPAARWETLAIKKLIEVNALIRKASATKELLEQMLRCECATLDSCASINSDVADEGLDVGVSCGN